MAVPLMLIPFLIIVVEVMLLLIVVVRGVRIRLLLQVQVMEDTLGCLGQNIRFYFRMLKYEFYKINLKTTRVFSLEQRIHF